MNQKQMPIAVVGYAYRAPGVSAEQDLWDYLADAKSAWTPFPPDRFDQEAYYHPNPERAGTFAVQGGHFLTQDLYRFDASFFNLRAEEAKAADPQHRMLLECAFEAADHAGLRLSDLAGSDTGVFSAIAPSDYSQQTADDPMSASNWTAPGTASTMFANRLSYFFDLIGPSVSLDTACASSGYAVHMACQSLRTGECKQAFVGGASLLLAPQQFTMLDTMGALSPKGRCYSYDHRAAGFGRGEGGACMMLKPLDQALTDGDPIQAVIRSSACNHSGHSDGITMPSKAAQVSLLRKVHQNIGLDPRDTPVVEGHGTGTLVGDRIELGAFAEVLAADRTPENPLYVGSLKSNFGHLESASGILALTKAVLMVQRGHVLPNADFERLGPAIDGIEKLRVLQEPLSWPEGAQRRVCMTNFGFGGSNAAILVEDLSSLQPRPQSEVDCISVTGGSSIDGTNHTSNAMHGGSVDGVNGGAIHADETFKTGKKKQQPQLFVLSAHSESSLEMYSSDLLKYLTEHRNPSDYFLDDLSFTLRQRRTQHAWRMSLTASSTNELEIGLSSPSSKLAKARHPFLGYIFTGQGAQYPQMALELRKFTVFDATMAEADRHLQSFGASWSLQEEIEKLGDDSRIDDADVSQPACTAVQLGLVALLRSWGVVPAAVTGHSSGEIAAAYAAGLLTIRSAIAIAYFRGQAAARLTAAEKSERQGAMLALGLGAEHASALLEQYKRGYVTIAAINSSRSVTVAGDIDAITDLQGLAEAKGLFCRRLKVGLGYHSQLMEPAADFYRQCIEPYCNTIPQTQENESVVDKPMFVSSVTGAPLDAKAINASYWVQNLLRPVQFLKSVQGMYHVLEDVERLARRKGTHVLLEVGPHSALKTPVQQTLSELQHRQESASNSARAYLSTVLRGASSEQALVELAGKLFCLGFRIDLSAVDSRGVKNGHVLTDLPRYVWDRSTRYIHQSRIGQARLHPGAPYDPLIGAKSPSMDGNEHVFRQVFTLDDIPWIREHKVNGKIIFPMTGFMAMAMAAARSVSTKTPAFLTLTEVHTKRSLEIAEDERLEMTTKLSPAETGTETTSNTLWAFRVSSWSTKRGWTTHCYGQVEPEMEEMSHDTPTFQRSLQVTEVSERETLDPDEEYRGHESVGTTYGPAYRVRQRFWKGEGWTQMESRLRTRDWNALSTRYGSPITVDAPSLDAHLQGPGPFWGDSVEERPALMPVYVSRLRISNVIAAGGKDRCFSIVSRRLEQDLKAGNTKVGIGVFDRVSEDHRGGPRLVPIAEWECVTYRSISSVDDDPVRNIRALGVPHSFYWDLTPSLDFVDDEILNAMLIEKYTKQEVEVRKDLNDASLHYMARALTDLDKAKNQKDLPALSLRFLIWAAKAIERYGSADAAHSGVLMDPESLTRIAQSTARAELICAVGEQLVPILRGEIQPLQIMLKNNLLWRQYEEDTPAIRLSQAIGPYLRSLLHVCGKLRVLEIGAGTGSATLPVLEQFSKSGSSEDLTLLNYTYTDISSGFFETARSKLQPWASSITYRKLDIGQDPLTQGFKAGEFDLVIAANVLHATADMDATMRHVQQIMRPNGKLVLLEALEHAPLTMPFAILPGWWLSEDNHRNVEMGPLLSREAWHGLLTETGFSGVDAAVHDFPDRPDGILGLMCTTKVGIAREEAEIPIAVCGAIRDAEEERFADLVAGQMTERLSCEASVKPIGEWDPEEDSICVVLDSPGHGVLQADEMSSEMYETIRNILTTAKALLWVVPDQRSPEHDVIRGILRSLRLEDASDKILLLEDAPWDEIGAGIIIDLARRLRDPSLARDLDQDFVVRDGRLQVPRMRPLDSADAAFSTALDIPYRKLQPIWQEDAAMELTVDAAGSPDYIYFRRNPAILADDLVGDEILIRNEAAGVNFRDLLVILGSIPWTIPGFEGVGTILRKGSNVSGFEVGDRVSYGCSAGGSYATCLRIPSSNVLKVPSHLTMEEAATILTPYTTAYMTLINIGRLRKGEKVLIHAASGGVGQACIVLAKHIGAVIFATAGSAEKRTFLHETMDIPEDHIYSSRTSYFRDSILRATDGRGVDVVVNSLSGKLLQDTWTVVGDCGRFLEIGKKDILENKHLAMRHFERNVSFVGVDLRLLFERRPEDMRDCLAQVADLLQQKIVQPIQPQTVFPVSQLAAGLRKLQSGTNVGKVVITMQPEDRVLAESAPLTKPPDPLLRRDATYMITGGTGGIGRSLTPWMFAHGAGNLVLLGRSGGSNPEVGQLVQQYESSPDFNLRAIACDVGSRESLVNALESIKDLPPVRGVIHGALSIRDAFFSNSSYADWKNTTTPKITAAWNLHDLLSDLDFFISLGSFLGAAGNAGQAIYSGTSSFLDAFTNYRNRKGLPSVSIALPIVLGVGYVAERAREDEMTDRVGITLTESQLHTLIEGAIFGPSSGLNRDGITSSFNIPSNVTLTGDWFHPRNLVHNIMEGGGASAHLGSSNADGEDVAVEDGMPPGLLGLLIQKVSSMTMIDRREMEADAPLDTYGLDSLVSVELRNWIRRETGVELSLGDIGSSESLAALASTITSLRKA